MNLTNQLLNNIQRQKQTKDVEKASGTNAANLGHQTCHQHTLPTMLLGVPSSCWLGKTFSREVGKSWPCLQVRTGRQSNRGFFQYFIWSKGSRKTHDLNGRVENHIYLTGRYLTCFPSVLLSRLNCLKQQRPLQKPLNPTIYVVGRSKSNNSWRWSSDLF